MKPKHLFWWGVMIVGLWVTTPIALKLLYPENLGERGQFGDMFGAVNALFTGAALFGAIYAIRLQTQELALQREELRNSTEEFRRQNEILKSQLDAARAAQAAAEAKERLASMPFLRYRGGTQDTAGDVLEFENVGGDIYDIEVSAEGGHVFNSMTRGDMWRNGEIARMAILSPPGGKHGNWAFTFHFTTKLGTRGSVRFEVNIKTGTPTKKDA